MSAENGLGGQVEPAGKLRRLKAVGTSAFAALKAPKLPRFKPNWRNMATNIGELAGISLISVGCGWYSFGAGFIGGGVGLLVWSVAAGTPVFQGKPEKR